MPARSAVVPKYCLHKPSGRPYVRIRGKVVYVGEYGTDDSKQEYGRVVAEFAARPALPLQQADDKFTVVELSAAYWDYAQSYYVRNGQSTSQVHIIRQALRAIKELYGQIPAADVGPLALQAVQSQLISRNLARKTINHFCGTIKRLFKWGVSQQLVPVAVYQALLTVPGVPKGRTKARNVARPARRR